MPLHRPTRRVVLLAAAVLLLIGRLHAQEREPALSDAEVETLRDLAPLYDQRVLAFVSFLDDRARAILRLSEGKRKPGREQDLHDLYEQFASIADDLSDNLDDYSRRHRDLRKALPKLVSATERWSTALKTAPDDDRYNVSRKLAQTSLDDVHESAVKLVDEQKAYFLAHPPAKNGSSSNER